MAKEKRTVKRFAFLIFARLWEFTLFIVGIKWMDFFYINIRMDFIKVAVMQHIMGERLWDCV